MLADQTVSRSSASHFKAIAVYPIGHLAGGLPPCPAEQGGWSCQSAKSASNSSRDASDNCSSGIGRISASAARRQQSSSCRSTKPSARAHCLRRAVLRYHLQRHLPDACLLAVHQHCLHHLPSRAALAARPATRPRRSTHPLLPRRESMRHANQLAPVRGPRSTGPDRRRRGRRRIRILSAVKCIGTK